jgi:hypothetical protein
MLCIVGYLIAALSLPWLTEGIGESMALAAFGVIAAVTFCFVFRLSRALYGTRTGIALAVVTLVPGLQ